MQLKQALENNELNYRTYLYKQIDGAMTSDIFNAVDAEKAINDGWHMSPADAMKPEELKKVSLDSTAGFDMTEEAREKVFKEMIIDNSVIANRLLNFDEITDIETLKEMAEPIEYKGAPLCDKINWNIKGKRKIEHIKRDLKVCLVELGLIDDNSKADN